MRKYPIKNKQLLEQLIAQSKDVVSYAELMDIQTKCGYRANNLVFQITEAFTRIRRGLYQKRNIATAQQQKPLIPKQQFLQSISDTALLNELSSRGYTGEISKKIHF